MTPAAAAPTDAAQPGKANPHAPTEAAGSKRKRVIENGVGVANGVADGGADGEATENVQGRKQLRLQSGDADGQPGDGSAGADAAELAFKALAHHRCVDCYSAALLTGCWMYISHTYCRCTRAMAFPCQHHLASPSCTTSLKQPNYMFLLVHRSVLSAVSTQDLV